MNLMFESATPAMLPRFLERLQEQPYLDTTLEQLGIPWEKFCETVATVGQVFSVRLDDQVVGYFWVELRERVLHIHGLIVDSAQQGRGIGSRIFKQLEATYRAQIDTLELGVQESNVRALDLYQRLGFAVVRTMPEIGFLIMQKQV